MTRAVSADEQRLARATKRAVEAAGGLKVCAAETGLSDSQISRCCNPAHRDSLTIRDAVTIDQIGVRVDDHPLILSAMARQLDCVVVPLPEASADPVDVRESMVELTSHLGAVARDVMEAIADGHIAPRECDAVLASLDALDKASARLRLTVRRHAGISRRPR